MGNALGSPRPCSECFRKLTTSRRKPRLTRLEDVLIFFDRSDLERISLSSRQLRHIVVNYFYDSPYLLLDNACVMIIHKSFALLKFRGIHYGEYFDQHTLNWIVLPDNSDWPQIEQEHLINIKNMYFPKWFRVDLAQIECSIFAEKPTEDAMDAYELNFDNATSPKSYVIVILHASWPILESRRNNVNEIWRKINGYGEKFFHNYDQEWDDGDTCLLQRFSIPSIL